MLINKSVSFVLKQEDPLHVVVDILVENSEHKKMTHPYVPLPAQVQTAIEQTATEIETETCQIDDEFANIKAE